MSEKSNSQAASGFGRTGVPESGADGCATIWDKVFKTEQEFMSDFNRGGFQGTAINPAYLVREATKVFGPAGLGWGWDIIKEEILEGAPLGWGSDGSLLGPSKIHKVQLKLWYMQLYCGEMRRGEITQFGQTTFVGREGMSDSIYTDEEAPKKSVTDALSKCLSYLGFAMDVYLKTAGGSKYTDPVQGPTCAATPKATSNPSSTRTPGSSSSPASQQSSQPSTSQQAASSIEGEMSRYEFYKKRLENHDVEIVSIPLARQAINQDSFLTQLEKGQLLSHERLKLGSDTAESVFI